jgi:hypothetical protein
MSVNDVFVAFGLPKKICPWGGHVERQVEQLLRHFWILKSLTGLKHLSMSYPTLKSRSA